VLGNVIVRFQDRNEPPLLVSPQGPSAAGGGGSDGIRRKYLPSLSTAQSHRFRELPVLLSDTDASGIFENGVLNSV